VTIGGRSASIGVPVIGDNVYISTGAKVLGDITIGNNCVIGANAVVISNVPDNTVAAGVPAKVIKQNINPKDFF
jgi:serine O-acetyltransferase